MNIEKRNFLDLYPKTMCNISKTCKQIGIGRSSYYNWIDDDHEFEREVKNAKEGLIDNLESEIYNQIFNKHNVIATIFALKCMGKNRGWAEQNQIPFENVKPIRVLEFGDPVLDEKI